MEYKKIGKSNVAVSPVVMGCWSAGGDYFGSVEDRDSIACIRTYLEHGINTFDTAEIYGMGRAERVLGMALKDTDRGKCTVFSKVWTAHYEAVKMEEACDASLQRMGLDYLDVYFLHYPPTGDISIGQVMENMNALKEKGKIKCIGVSNFSLELLQEALKYGEIDVIQPCYNLLWRYIDKDILPFCNEHGIAVIPYSTLAQGLLTGRFTSTTKITGGRTKAALFQPGVYEKCLTVTQKLVALGEKYGYNAAQVCVNWLVHNKAITAPIVGGANPQHAQENINALGFSMEEEDYELIDRASAEFCAQLPEYEVFFDTKIKGE